MKYHSFNAVLFCSLLWLSLPRQSLGAISEQDIKNLQHSTHYFRGLVGFAGDLSDQDLLFEKILEDRDAESIFMETIYSKHATPEAKAYAACGLSKIKSRRFQEAANNKENSTLNVTTMNGDILKKEKYSTIIKRIIHGGC
ncbi:hypothetical protein WKW80_19245 [Variovorax humicola]|uniref:Uncharacterized protein n=1 Tax=Variovorax humicola TaxID=1769758 RepID=A0ABU8W261_9BURK